MSGFTSPQIRSRDHNDKIPEFDLDAFAEANGITREASPTNSPPGSPSVRTSREARYTLYKPPEERRGGNKYTRKLKMGSRKYKTSKTNKKQGGKKSKTGKKRSSRTRA